MPMDEESYKIKMMERQLNRLTSENGRQPV